MTYARMILELLRQAIRVGAGAWDLVLRVLPFVWLISRPRQWWRR